MFVKKNAKRAPTRQDRPFHYDKTEYAEHSITKALGRGQITPEDVKIIKEFVAEQKGIRGISVGRVNKMTFNLVSWRKYLGRYESNSITDLYEGIARMRSSTVRGHPIKQNTTYDYVRFLKRFYVWLIENGYSSIPARKVTQIKTPKMDMMTKTSEQLLTEKEVCDMIDACTTSRHRALISMLYEGAFRVKEIGTLTWEQVKFDEYGLVINVNMKTERPRYIRMVSSLPYLAAWRNDYPFNPEGNGLVFITRQNTPLQYESVAKQLRQVAERAGITKRVPPHIFRHSRITHLLQHGVHESIIKAMCWGNQGTKMLETYGHLTDNDVDNAILQMHGIPVTKGENTHTMVARSCPFCHTINGPTMNTCVNCGRLLTGDAVVEIEHLTKEIEQHPIYQTLMRELDQRLMSQARH